MAFQVQSTLYQKRTRVFSKSTQVLRLGAKLHLQLLLCTLVYNHCRIFTEMVGTKHSDILRITSQFNSSYHDPYLLWL